VPKEGACPHKCVAVWCSVLKCVSVPEDGVCPHECVTVWCSWLQCVAVRRNVVYWNPNGRSSMISCSVLQCVVVCCSVLQCVAVCCIVL